MTTRRDFIKLAGMATVGAAVGVPVVAEAAPEFLVHGRYASGSWPQMMRRMYRNRYTATAFGNSRVLDASGKQIDSVSAETVGQAANLIYEWFSEGPTRDMMPVYMGYRENEVPVAYVTGINFSEHRLPKTYSPRAGRPDQAWGQDINGLTHLFPEDTRAELAVTLISARDDLDGMFVGPTLHYDKDDPRLLTETPPPVALRSWGMFPSNPRWLATPLVKAAS